MRVLLDTQIVLSLASGSLAKRHSAIADRLSQPSTIGFVSAVSLWEIAIKTRLGKLELGMPLQDFVGFLDALGLAMLRIEVGHVITVADPESETRDPFDRLLLAQCVVEDLVLATLDRALANHRLAMKI